MQLSKINKNRRPQFFKSARTQSLPMAPFFLLITFLAGASQAIASEPGGKVKMMKAKIFHETRELFEREAAGCKCARMEPAAIGTKFIDTFVPDKIKSISLQGDQVDLPSPLAAQTLGEAKFAAVKMRQGGSKCPGRVRMLDGNCLPITFHIDDKHRLYEVETPIGVLETSTINCAAIDKLKNGMTRAAMEKYATADGGISIPFKYERYVVSGSKPDGQGAVLKFNLSFKPAGMSDALYYLGKWAPPKQSPEDIVMRISPFYQEKPFCD